MPIYEYKCEACGHVFESLQKISESPLVECPDCGKDTLKKLISSPAFRLKGGGWYETDFKRVTRRMSLTLTRKKRSQTRLLLQVELQRPKNRLIQADIAAAIRDLTVTG